METIVLLLLKTLTGPLKRELGDMLLDFVEEKVLGSASPIDDAIVLPICKALRDALEIPEGDD